MNKTKTNQGTRLLRNILKNPTSDTDIFKKVFSFFRDVDKKYSPFKKTSEVSKINSGVKKTTAEMQEILDLCEKTRQETNGYFDVYQHGVFNPSGLVKGWAINKAADIIKNAGYEKFYIDAGGDIAANGIIWKVGIRNPFVKNQIDKVLRIKGRGVATSGNYERGRHIFNPIDGKLADEIASITVVGPNIYAADRMATAAFAMGKDGINFLEKLPGFEGYMIDNNKIATKTSGFDQYEID